MASVLFRTTAAPPGSRRGIEHNDYTVRSAHRDQLSRAHREQLSRAHREQLSRAHRDQRPRAVITMQYVRIFSDPTGASHFEDVTVPPAPGISEPARQLSAPLDVGSMLFRHVEALEEPPWHVAPRRQFVVHLEGSVEVEVSDGEVRRFGPGSVVLLEDVEGDGHLTRPIDGGRTTLFITLEPAPEC
jgi:hypothetical protein